VRFDTAMVAAAASEMGPRLTAHRRALHRIPELGFAEHRTAAYIESALTEFGIAHRRVCGTGIVAVIPGEDGRCVGIRADMDALPVPEAEGREGYRSEIEGRSHACGHDAHVAIVLGLAELLARVERLPGTVVLYFQPAEEGPGGAKPMVAAGVLDDPAPEAILALHVNSTHRSGHVAVRSGPSTGSNDHFDIIVQGMGGHAAHPDRAVDPIPIAASIIASMQHLLDREVDPVVPALVTWGSIHGGTRRNVIATSVVLEGTLRTLDPRVRAHLIERIHEVAQGHGTGFRANVQVRHHEGYAVGINDAALTAVVQDAAVSVLGADRVVPWAGPTLGAEDFYAFGDTGVPVSMFLLGVADRTRGSAAPNHSPAFDIDERALPAGVATFAESLRRLLLAPPRAPR